MGNLPVLVRGLEKRFGRRVALSGVELDVRPGEIVGLVGPNGSGKTTLLRLLAGLTRPDAGEVRLFGLDPYAEGSTAMESARFAFAPPALFDRLSAREHLIHMTRIGRGRSSLGRSEIDATLERVGLADRAKDRVGTFSFGMRQRLALAMALLPRPRLVVLDEPTDGLDPLAVLELRGLLVELAQQEGIAVLLSSHLLGEVQELVDRMLVLHEGKTLFFGKPADMMAGSERLRIEASDVDGALSALIESGHTGRVLDGEVELSAWPSLEETRHILRQRSIELLSYRIHRPGLEQAVSNELRRIQAPENGAVGERS